MTLPLDPELGAAVDHTFPQHALAEAVAAQQLDGWVLEQTRADALLDVLTRVPFEDDGLDPVLGEKVGEHEARRTRADNSYLGPDHLRLGLS